MPTAVTSYLVVEALHVMAVIAAYGLPLAYPLLLPYMRRNHPRAMPGVHDVQHRLNVLLTGPGTVLILAFGAYLASRHHLWDETWVQVPIGIIVVIGLLGGAHVVPASKRMSALARADVDATAPGGSITWSLAYERTYRRYMATEVLLGALVLTAIFFMTAQPFA
jgi:uncharacterized membrane protein